MPRSLAFGLLVVIGPLPAAADDGVYCDVGFGFSSPTIEAVGDLRACRRSPRDRAGAWRDRLGGPYERISGAYVAMGIAGGTGF